MQWNSHGYDIAKTFANKFDLISPVWLQVTPTPGGKGYVMTGEQTSIIIISSLIFNLWLIQGLHDVDKNWMKTVKSKSSQSKVKSMDF